MPDTRDLHDALMDCLVDDMESTDMVVLMLREVELSLDSAAVEETMRGLEADGLVASTEGWSPLRRDARDTWWRLTERGWLTVAASGRFADDEPDPLAGDSPPLRSVIAGLLNQRRQTITELTDALLRDWGELWPHLAPAEISPPEDQSRVYERAERSVGKMALDGLVSAEATDGLHHRWALTPKGRAALEAFT